MKQISIHKNKIKMDQKLKSQIKLFFFKKRLFSSSRPNLEAASHSDLAEGQARFVRRLDQQRRILKSDKVGKFQNFVVT